MSERADELRDQAKRYAAEAFFVVSLVISLAAIVLSIYTQVCGGYHNPLC